MNKPRFETELAETGWLLNDIIFACRNLHKWMKDEKAEDIELTYKFMSPKIRKDPLGVVLVIGLEAPLRICTRAMQANKFCSLQTI